MEIFIWVFNKAIFEIRCYLLLTGRTATSTMTCADNCITMLKTITNGCCLMRPYLSICLTIPNLLISKGVLKGPGYCPIICPYLH